MNILILSCGTRDKVVQYFKNAVGNKGKVITTDCSPYAPALYEGDQHYIVPPMVAEGYLDVILDICKKEAVTGVLSLIDPELSLLAENKERFLAIGTTPIISDFNLVETCFDKWKMFQLLQDMNVKTGKCYIEKEKFFEALKKGEISYPVFVKPITGSASININKVSCDEEIEVLFKLYDGLMIQEFMDGQEYGADVYIDMISGKASSIFTKKKLKMRAGETDKALSVKDDKLFEFIRKFVEKCGFRGIIDMDIFEIHGEYYLSEVNPRFGGGYPHAYECGVDVPAQIVNNLEGKENPVSIGNYEENIAMMKYNEVMIRKIEEA